jgi:acetyl-CoA carboxylase biotin carboxyl carrier protein
MTLTARDIAEITRLLEDSSFDELELEIDGLKIHLRRGNGDSPPNPREKSLAKGDGPQTPTREQEPVRAVSPPSPPGNAHDPALTPVRAPLLGTYYRAPKPGAPPFVDTGATVEPDTVIGIIEVMKLMNAVRAGTRGVVREIRARDGTLVEYGEILLLVDARGPG